MSQEDQNQTPETEQASVETEQTPEARIAELEAQLAEQQAAVLYVKAEGENIRRRATDDIDKARKYALEKFSGELLAVKDSLDAALGVAERQGYHTLRQREVAAAARWAICSPCSESWKPGSRP